MLYSTELTDQLISNSFEKIAPMYCGYSTAKNTTRTTNHKAWNTPEEYPSWKCDTRESHKNENIETYSACHCFIT